MTFITPEEIAKVRSELEDYSKQDEPKAIEVLSILENALETLEECNYNLELATEVLAIEAGKPLTKSPKVPLEEYVKELLETEIKTYRSHLHSILCQGNLRKELIAGLLVGAIVSLINSNSSIPAWEITPIVMYIYKTGVEEFCNTYTA